ncbi:MAG: flavodoxin family protein [Acidimicrobiales bacterium]
MNVLVAYESRSGRTRRAAEAVAAAVRARGSDAILKTLAETAAEDIEHADAVAIGTWVEGFIVAKVGPAKAALEAIGQLPAIGGKPVAVFCTYGVTPRTTLATLRRSLEAKGANVVAENASHRSHPDRGADELAQRLCTAPEAT